MDNTEFTKYYLLFEKMQTWIINDLRNSTIKAKANFLVALGIFNYIEILGAFHKHEKKTDTKTVRFNYAFNNYFPHCYSEKFKKIEEITAGGAYTVLRCGMSHEYLISSYKGKNSNINIEYTIYGVDNPEAYNANVASRDCGIELLELEKDNYHMRIYNPKFIEDLNQAFETYKAFVRSDDSYKLKFIAWCKEIHLENFN